MAKHSFQEPMPHHLCFGARFFTRVKANHRRIYYSRILAEVCAVAMATGLVKDKAYYLDCYLNRSWTFGDPYFPFDGSFSLPIFYVLRKNEKNLWSRILNILQNAPSNSVHLTSSFSCASVSNASLRVKVSENDGNI